MAAPPGVQGVAETLAALREFPRATGRATLRRALVTAVQPVAAVATALAPDDPKTPAPDLKRSIAVTTQLTRRHRRARENEVEVHVGPTTQSGRSVLSYASIQEFGSYKQVARPFLRPAWDSQRALVMVLLARQLTIEFEAAAARLSRKFFKLR